MYGVSGEGVYVKLNDAQESAINRSGVFDGVDFDRQTAEIQELVEGDHLCRKGQQGDCIWIVLEGTINVQGAGPETEETTVVTHTVGDVIGEQAIVSTSGERTADLRAVSGPVRLLSLTKHQIDTHENAGAIYRNLARVLSNKLAQATGQRTELQQQNRRDRQLLRRFIGTHALSHEMLAPPDWQGPGYYDNRRLVFWFSDIVGFSRISDNMPPADLAQLLPKALAPQIKSILDSKGFVDKLIGDAVFGYWPCDRLGDDKAIDAAVRAAIESIKVVNKIKVRDSGGTVDLRIGLHIGQASVGNYGTDERAQITAIGSAVNDAARYEQFSAAQYKKDHGSELGPIRISPDIHEHLSPALQAEFQPFETITMKDKQFEGYSWLPGNK